MAVCLWHNKKSKINTTMTSKPASYRTHGTPPRSSLRAEARIHSRQHPWNRRRERVSRPSFPSTSWDAASSNSGSADSSIFKGAEILRAQIQRQQQEAENDIVLRGAASVKAQLMTSERGRSPAPSHSSDDDWSDPWEPKAHDNNSEGTHPQISETSSSASASRLSTPHSDFSSGSFVTPTSEESSRMFREESYESFDDVKRTLDMNSASRSPEVRMRRFEDSIDEESDDDSSSFRPRGDSSEWKRRTSSESIPKPRFQGEEAVVYSEEEDSSDEEKNDLRVHYQEASRHSSGELDDMGFPIVGVDGVPEWTDSSATSTEPPPPPARDPPTPPPPPPADSPETPVTLMGRGNSLKLKIHTYNVQRTEDFFTDSDTFSNDTYSTIESPSSGTKSSGSYDDLVYSMSLEDTPPSSRDSLLGNVNRGIYSDPDLALSASSSSFLPGKYSGQGSRHDDSDEDGSPSSYIPRQLQPERTSPALSPRILSPMTATYCKLARDPAYRHAQRAGLLWQTLASQHVRFPGHWWDGARSPQMGMLEDYSGNGKAHCDWKYLARHRVYSNPQLKKLVRNRASPGRLLLHIVVRDLMTYLPVQDIAIGCFHPNARGVRRTENPDPKEEDCREVWMAVRKRCEDGAVSAVDRYLTRGRSIEDLAQKSPLSGKPRVSNQNMRAVSALYAL